MPYRPVQRPGLGRRKGSGLLYKRIEAGRLRWPRSQEEAARIHRKNFISVDRNDDTGTFLYPEMQLHRNLLTDYAGPTFSAILIPSENGREGTAVAFSLKEKELADLDKQTLIKMLVAATESNQKLSEAAEQLQKSVNLLTEEVNLRQHRFGRSSEKGLTSGEDGCSQLSFAFNEAEMTIDLDPAFPESELEDILSRKAYKRGKRKQEDVRKRSKVFRWTVVTHTLSGRRTALPFSGWLVQKAS